MDISSGDNVSFQDVLSQALVWCQDEELRNGFTRGYYVSTIQRGLEELGFDTFYKTITEHVKMNKDCFQVEMPCNMFNVREMYLFSGECDKPQNSVRVNWKRLFNNGKGGTDYTANRTTNNSTDPYSPYSYVNSSVYYANIVNGLIMLSFNSNGFDWLRLVGNGAGTPIGDQPVIPRFFRTMLCDFVAEDYYRVMSAKDRMYRPDWEIYYKRLNEPYVGSRAKAENRVKMLSTWKKENLHEDFGNKADWGGGGWGF